MPKIDIPLQLRGIVDDVRTFGPAARKLVRDIYNYFRSPDLVAK
jgi:hypothetical protein